MLRISLSWGRVPELYFMSKRAMPSAFAVAAIRRLVEMRPGYRRPATLGADPVAHGFVMRPKFFARLRVGVGDIAVGMQADGFYRPAGLGIGALVEIDEGHETPGIAADDGQH